MIIGIDATNLRRGGGLTHLIELLRVSSPLEHNFDRIVVWGGSDTLNALDDFAWIHKRNPSCLNKGLVRRTLWQRFNLSKAARDEGCDILFVPGGSYAGNFYPVVTMSQNLLPFEMPELRRYGWTIFTLKMLLLRFVQSRSYINASGIIFLSRYAYQTVTSVTGKLNAKTCQIPHGLNSRFKKKPKLQHHISHYSHGSPYRILYVSIIDQYKHQWFVVEAIANLRKLGLPIVLDLVGPAYSPALARLNKAIDHFDPERSWVFYHGAVPFVDLHLFYMQADLGLFASSCENMPNILLEMMSSGLPIACSNRGPMPEVLGNSGLYFDPESPDSIRSTLHELIDSAYLRFSLSNSSYLLSQKYTWQFSANETFKFLAKVKES